MATKIYLLIFLRPVINCQKVNEKRKCKNQFCCYQSAKRLKLNNLFVSRGEDIHQFLDSKRYYDIEEISLFHMLT